MNRQYNFPSDRSSKLRKRCAKGVVASGIALVLFGFAGSAQAGNEFESGFQFELGRIAANHLAAVTQLVLGAHVRPEVVVVEANYRPQPRPHYRTTHRHHARCGHDVANRRGHDNHARAHHREHRRPGNFDRDRDDRRHDERRHDYRGQDKRRQDKRPGDFRRGRDRKDDPRDDRRSDRHDARTRQS